MKPQPDRKGGTVATGVSFPRPVLSAGKKLAKRRHRTFSALLVDLVMRELELEKSK